MFTDEDVNTAEPVISLNDEFATRVCVSSRNGEEPSLTPLAPAVVVLSFILLTAPAGAVLETTRQVIDSVKQFTSKQKESSSTYPMKEGGTHIKANNSNVQNVHVINNGGNVSVQQGK